MNTSMMETPRPMEGTWTLTAPDGRKWQASSPILCCRAEQSERVPADVALARVMEAVADDPEPLLSLVERLRYTPNWMRESYGSWKDCVLKYDRAPFEAADAIERLAR